MANGASCTNIIRYAYRPFDARWLFWESETKLLDRNRADYVAQVFDGNPKAVDGVFGAPIGAILGKYAIGKPPADSTGINLPVLLRAITKVLGWRLRGRAWPNPFFQPKTREPAYPIAVLAEAQRETLRSLCGPKPAAL